MQIKSIANSLLGAVPFYTVHKSGTWMVVHQWSDGTNNGAQALTRQADGPFTPIIWGTPY